MIDLNDLKPILEKLDVDASVIQNIMDIDKEPEPSDSSKEVEELKAQLEQTNKDWNEKFKKAFFSGEGIPDVNKSHTSSPIAEPVEEESTPMTYADVAKEFIKEV